MFQFLVQSRYHAGIACFRKEPVDLTARVFEIRIMEEKYSGSVGHVTGIAPSTYTAVLFYYYYYYYYLLTAIGLTPGGSGYTHVHKYKLGI